MQLASLICFSMALAVFLRQTIVLRLTLAIFLIIFILLQIVSFFIQGCPFDSVALNYLHIDILKDSLYVFKWWLVLLVFIGLSLFVAFVFIPLKLGDRRLVKSSFAEFGILFFFLAAMALPGGILPSLYSIVTHVQAAEKQLTLHEAFVELGLDPAKYVARNQLKVEVNKPKNVVYISLESYDRLFLENPHLTPKLNEWTKRWNYFPNFQNTHGTVGTINHVFASYTGLPALFGKPVTSFLNNASASSDFVSLPQVFKTAGYRLHSLMAVPNYASKGIFLEKLGFDKVSGDKMQDYPPNIPHSKWNVYDKDLFELAKKEFMDLSRSEQPFLLSLITVDTHFNSEVYDPRMDDVILEGTKQEKLVKWIDYLVDDFLHFLEESGELENTVVLVVPDHPVTPRIDINYLKKLPIETHGIYLLTNVSAEELGIEEEEELFKLGLSHMMLSAAGIQSNAVFLKDLYIQSQKEPEQLPEYIKQNEQALIHLVNAAFVDTPVIFEFTREGDRLVFDDSYRKRTVTLKVGEVAVVDLAPYAFATPKQLGAIDQLISTVPQGEIRTNLKNPFLLIVEVVQLDNTLKAYNHQPLFGSSRSYTGSETNLRVELNTVLESIVITKATDNFLPINPLVYGLEAAYTKGDHLKIISIGSDSTYQLGIAYTSITVNGQTTPINERGITVIHTTESDLELSAYNISESTEAADVFIKHLEALVQGDKFWALTVRDTAAISDENHRAALNNMGLPNLATLKHREPYIAFRDSEGNIVELRPPDKSYEHIPTKVEVNLVLPYGQIVPKVASAP